jgi:DNA-binding SARP family transcriptional activator
VEVCILGPVEVRSGTEVLHLARRQHRVIIGILALEANRTVTVDRLIELIWAGSPPRKARAVVHSRVSELRSALGGISADARRELLLTADDGYLLRVEQDRIDAHQFQQLLYMARTSRSDRERGTLLRQSLGLWRGPMFGGWLPYDSHAALCTALESARLTAAEDFYDLELRLGDHRAVVDELLGLSTANPGREKLAAQVMLALHRTGRSADAIEVYERTRHWLRTTVGLDPGETLQALSLAMLRGDGTAMESLALTARPVKTTPDVQGSELATPGSMTRPPRSTPARSSPPRPPLAAPPLPASTWD